VRTSVKTETQRAEPAQETTSRLTR
jgi:hypothetical protein